MDNNESTQDKGLTFPEISLELDDADFNELTKTTELDEEGQPITDDTTSAGEAGSEGEEKEYGEEADQDAINAYNIWVSKGLIPEIEDFDGTFEKLEEITEHLPQTIANTIVERSPEIGQKVVDYVFAKGANLTSEDLKTFMDLHLSAETVPTEEFTDTLDAKKYLYEKFSKTMDLEEDVIDGLLDKLEEKDQLLDRANKELGTDKEKLAQQRESLIQQEKEAENNRKAAARQFEANLVESLKETNWDKQRVSKIYQEYSSGTTQDKFNKASANPKAFLHVLNFLTYFDLEKEEFNFDDFIKFVGTDNNNETKKNLLRDMLSSSGSKGVSTKRKPEHLKEFNLDDYDPV